MKPRATGTLSGCIVWIIVFGIFCSCTVPMGMMIGGFTSASNFAMQTIGPIICPDGTSAESYSYATTTTDEYGNTQPSTAYELHCVDENGVILKKILFYTHSYGLESLLSLDLESLLCLPLHWPRLLGY